MPGDTADWRGKYLLDAGCLVEALEEVLKKNLANAQAAELAQRGVRELEAKVRDALALFDHFPVTFALFNNEPQVLALRQVVTEENHELPTNVPRPHDRSAGEETAQPGAAVPGVQDAPPA